MRHFLMLFLCACSVDVQSSSADLRETHEAEEIISYPEREDIGDLNDVALSNSPCLCSWVITEERGLICLEFVCPDDCAVVCSTGRVCRVEGI